MTKVTDCGRAFFDGEKEQLVTIAAEVVVQTPTVIADLLYAMRLCGALSKIGVSPRMAGMVLHRRYQPLKLPPERGM